MAYVLQTSSSESISQFIATQGPLLKTIEDFWEMVIQQHCPVIVMLTRLVDNNMVLVCINYKLFKKSLPCFVYTSLALWCCVA